MKTKNYFMIPVLAFLACACQDDEIVKPTPTPGEAVQFGSLLGQNSSTRTIYGPEDETNHVFPILWLKGDQVVVTSPQCGVKRGTYQVPDEADMQNYADPLQGVDDANVQWGNTEKADFYSIYPASGVKSVGSDYKSFTLTMPAVQENPVEVIDGKKIVKPVMNGCFMSARTKDVFNGATVELQYEPLSTAIRFTVLGGDNSTEQNRKTIIEKIVLRAPEGVAIAGDFTVSFAEDGTRKYTPVGTGSNEIEIIPYYKESSGYVALNLNEGVELNAFIIPQNQEMAFSGWELEVYLTDNNSYKTNLQATGTGQNLNLKAGMIHRLGDLKNLPVLKKWDKNNWMQYIPRNVYLSEISIPGSWNSINTDLQINNSIEYQYSEGARAFHFDICWRANTTAITFYKPSEIGDLGIADGSTRLPVKTSFMANSQGEMTSDKATSFKGALNDITSKLKPNEYMILFCTFANNSYDPSDKSWIEEVCQICSMNDKVMDANEITSETVVGEVLGKLIVIVSEVKDDGTEVVIPSGSKCLFTNLKLRLDDKQFTNDKYNSYPLKRSVGKSDITFNYSHSQMTWYTSSWGNANYDVATGSDTDRGYAPSRIQRKAIAQNIFDESRTNYEADQFTHNVWRYLGFGGYYTKAESGSAGSNGAHDALGKYFADYINNDIIGKMTEIPGDGETGYYPVGIILMNRISTVAEVKTAINEIMALNTKYRKAYDPDRSSETGLPLTPSQSDVTSAAPGFSGGVTDNNEDAFNGTSSN